MDLYVCILKMHTTPILLDVLKSIKGAYQYEKFEKLIIY